MKIKRHRVQFSRNLRHVFMILLFLGLFAALPAGAQSNESAVEQELIPDSAFKNWYTMHKNSFCTTNSCAVDQCVDSIGKVVGLSQKHCDTLSGKLDAGVCEEKFVADGTKYRWMRGRVNGNPNGASKLTPNLIKTLGRHDRALRCDLGDGIIVDWFTGDEYGRSCNNLGFLYQAQLPEVKSKTVSGVTCRKVRFSDPVNTSIVDYHQSLVLPGCNDNLYIPSSLYYSGSSIQSNGYTIVCD